MTKVIRCDGVSKRFRIPMREQMSLRGRVLHPFARPSYREFLALDNVSFEVERGEFLGIIGRNGSGKSTLLKILAGIYRADSGSVMVDGTLAAFIELGVGFNMDLTGRDNLFINGSLLGMSRREIRRRYDEIVDFAELDGFMDMKLRNFSSGMQVRLAFSVALRADTDVLLTDEVLAVGDARFQEKCYEVFRERKQRGQTIVFVSHDMGAVQQFCDRAVLIDDGTQVAVGETHEMARRYLQLNTLPTSTDVPGEQIDSLDSESPLQVMECWTEDEDGHRSHRFASGREVRLCARIRARREHDDAVVGVTVEDRHGQHLFSTSTLLNGTSLGSMSVGDEQVVVFEFSNFLASGDYVISVSVASKLDDATTGPVLEFRRDAAYFTAIAPRHSHGMVDLPVVVSVRDDRTRDTSSVVAPGPQTSETNEAARHVVVSTYGASSGGGLFAIDIDSGGFEQIDHLSSTGLSVGDDTLLRMLMHGPDEHGSELVEYGRDGVQRYLRLLELGDAHDVLLEEDGFTVVSTLTNEIVTMGFDGSAREVWHGDGSGDAWHLNCVTRVNGQLYATAFGRFANHREWEGDLGNRSGILITVPQGETVIGGLERPHSPRRVDGTWLVCDSGTGRVTRYNDAGQLLGEIDLGGWTRGLEVLEDVVVVGISGRRSRPGVDGGAASVVVLDRRDLAVLRRVALPVDEVHDIRAVDSNLLQGIRTGFNTNGLRLREQDRHGLIATSHTPRRNLWLDGGELLPSQMRVRMEAAIIDEPREDGSFHATCTVANTGARSYVSALPYPVHLGYRWVREDGTTVSEGRRRLPHAVEPGDVIALDIAVDGAERAGCTRVVFSLVQEGVQWFDFVDPGAAAQINIEAAASMGVT